ncbi:hypothetical protein CYJ89_05550 [Lactobacillus jensenii]|jgi:hypothetical protein|nr:hypothetical protein BUE77_08080 [Lactobacillus jensenii]ERJ42453.1 hypothetical protein N581_10430 [Lactobacillus jensenii MD IIE-70(2)]PLA47906.1 hypothetical protein CYJ89_05550 [Lactobacillus jensenii]
MNVDSFFILLLVIWYILAISIYIYWLFSDHQVMISELIIYVILFMIIVPLVIYFIGSKIFNFLLKNF